MPIAALAIAALSYQAVAPSSRPLRSRAIRLVDTELNTDLNWLHTKLQVALENEDYTEAASVRNRIRRSACDGPGVTSEAAWTNLGVPDWLADRLERLNYPLPTSVQLHSLRAFENGDDTAVCAPTGSGKTLSYLLPLLTQLSDDLLSEDLGNSLASILDGGRPTQRSAKGAERRRAARQNVGEGVEATAVPTPAVLIVVPTRELGVQVSMLCYRLLGGGATNPALQPYRDPSRYAFGSKANMFSYQGPRHVTVAGLWDENALYAAAYQDLLNGVHVIVGTPEYLSRVAEGAAEGGTLGLTNLDGVEIEIDETDKTFELNLQNVRGVVIDEADAVLGPETRPAMETLLRRMRQARKAAGVPPPQTMLVGASLTPELVRDAVDRGWVHSPTLVSELGRDDGWSLEGGARVAEALAVPAGAAGARAWTAQRVPAGHAHEYIIAEPRESVATICRMLRERFETAAEEDAEAPPPRVVVFAPSAEDAVALASRLQGALFGSLSGDSSAGLWGLSVLLPSAEARLASSESADTLSVLESSLRVMEMFACDRTSVLVTTASATRGLDFPHVSDVYNLGIVGSAADYVHRAGRVGRVGQTSRGSVVSVLAAAEVSELLDLGRTLQFTPVERAPPKPTEALNDEMSQEAAVQALSDLYNLFE